METTNTQMPTAERAIAPQQRSQTSPGVRLGLIIAAVVAAATIALALGQQWLSTAALVPLLFILPCAAMMFMCMKGNGHGLPTNLAPVSTQGKTPDADTRN